MSKDRDQPTDCECAERSKSAFGCEELREGDAERIEQNDREMLFPSFPRDDPRLGSAPLRGNLDDDATRRRRGRRKRNGDATLEHGVTRELDNGNSILSSRFT